jgi:hypothetical protein
MVPTQVWWKIQEEELRTETGSGAGPGIGTTTGYILFEPEGNPETQIYGVCVSP